MAGDGCSTNDVFFNQQTEISKTEIRDEETAFVGYNANEQSYDSLLPDCLPCKDNYCHNCFRCSTRQLPLLFLSVPSSKLVRRIYGTKYSSESTVFSVSIAGVTRVFPIVTTQLHPSFITRGLQSFGTGLVPVKSKLRKYGTLYPGASGIVGFITPPTSSPVLQNVLT